MSEKNSEHFSGMAITGFVLSFIWFLFPLALVFSAIGISATKNGKMRGRGLAIAGLVLSLIPLAVALIGILWAAIIPSIESPLQESNQDDSTHLNVSSVYKAGGVYFRGNSSISRNCYGVEPYQVCSGYQIVGELLNNGTKSYQTYQIKINANFYKSNQLVDTDYTYADTNLSPGGETTYKLLIMKDLEFDNYKLTMSIN